MPNPRLLIIGGGTAGLPAALAALDAEAEVVLIEKADRLGGTLWLSGVYMSASQSAIHRAKGLDDSPEAHAEDVQRIGRSRAHPELLQTLTARAGETIDWLGSLGITFTPASPFHHLDHELYRVPRSFEVEAPAEYGIRKGRVLLDAFERELEGRPGLTVRLGTRVTALVRADGRVTGVELASGERIEGSAVLLATGGFAANGELLKRFHPMYERLLTSGMETSTGDGVLLGEAAGAEIVNQDLVLPVPGGIEDPDRLGASVPRGLLVMGRPPARAGDIWVNLSGERFMREDSDSPDQRERAIAAQADATMFAIFDEPMRAGLEPDVASWTASVLADPRLIVSAATVERLASATGLPPASLASTVAAYNQAVGTGADALGRRAMPKAIDTPPFHSVRSRGALGLTMPGVRIDAQTRVLDPTGSPIPGLYAAGEVVGGGQLQGHGYSGGMMSTSAITLGRLAAWIAVEAGATTKS